MKSEEYIEKWLNGTLSDEELRVFKQTKDFESLSKLDAALQQFKAPEYDVQSELEQLNARKKAKGNVVHVSWMQPVLRIAAVVVMALVGYYFIFFNTPTKVKTGIAEKVEVGLPDNSVVMLNALSSISYSEDKWQEKRQLNLTGEAYFKVAKGSKFDVVTDKGIVSVLGTQFNVKVRDNYFEVVCYEGLVAVESGNNKIELPPGSMFRIINGKIFNTKDLNTTAPDWLNNESSFISIPFKYVIKEIETQYDVSITTNNVDLEQLFTGRFTHDSLSLALKSISLPLNLQYKIVDNNKIELLSDIE